MDTFVLFLVVVLGVGLVGLAVYRSVTVVKQATAAVIERLGKYRTTAQPGLAFLVPFMDKIRRTIDLREQVVSFPPQPVITQDNLTVSIDTVVYYQVTDPRAAVYEISDYILGVEQLTITTLRNVVGGMSLEKALTSRDEINGQLRGVLDEATGRWGIRVARVELKAIDPPPSIQESMERQMKADREKRAVILTAEGNKQSQILTAEGAKQAAILTAEAERQSRILRAEGDRAARYLQAQGQAKAIEKVFAAIKAGKPTPELLAYQYLQTLPQMAQGEANKVWLVPSDFGKALEGFTRMLGAPGEDGVFRFEASPVDGAEQIRPEDDDEGIKEWFEMRTDPEIARAVAAAEALAHQDVLSFSPVTSAVPAAPVPAPGPRSIPPGGNRGGPPAPPPVLPATSPDGGVPGAPVGYPAAPRTEPAGRADPAPQDGGQATPPGRTSMPPGYPQPPNPS